MEHSYAQVLARHLQLFCNELPGEAYCITFEVVSKGEIAEHFEKRVMPGRVSDLLQIVVFAAGTHALLRRCGPAVAVGRVFHAEEDSLELNHPCVGEQQGWVICGHQRGTGTNGVAVFFEVGQESGTNFGREHSREI